MFLSSRKAIIQKYADCIEKHAEILVRAIFRENGHPSYSLLLNHFDSAISDCIKYKNRINDVSHSLTILKDISFDLLKSVISKISPRDFYSKCDCNTLDFIKSNVAYSIEFRDLMKSIFKVFFLNGVLETDRENSHFISQILKKVFSLKFNDGTTYPWSFYEILPTTTFIEEDEFRILLSNADSCDLSTLKERIDWNATVHHDNDLYLLLKFSCTYLELPPFSKMDCLVDYTPQEAYKKFVKTINKDYTSPTPDIESTLWLLSNYKLLIPLFPSVFFLAVNSMFQLFLSEDFEKCSDSILTYTLADSFIELLEVMKDYKLYQLYPFSISHEDLENIVIHILSYKPFDGYSLNKVADIIEEGFGLRKEFEECIRKIIRLFWDEEVIVFYLSNKVVFDNFNMLQLEVED